MLLEHANFLCVSVIVASLTYPNALALLPDYCVAEKLETYSHASPSDEEIPVSCRAFATAGYWDILKCCIKPWADLNATCPNGNLSLVVQQYQMELDIACEVKLIQGQSCCDAELVLGAAYNISVLCNGNQTAYRKVGVFNESDGQFEPIIVSQISIANVTAKDVVVSYPVASCRIIQTVTLVNVDASNKTEGVYFVNCSSLRALHAEKCSITHPIELPLRNLLSNTHYQLSIRQKRVDSYHWSEQTLFSFKTPESIPDIGPELSPGVVRFLDSMSCSKQLGQAINITVIWKPQTNTTITHGIITLYSLLIKYSSGETPAKLIYSNTTEKNSLAVTIIPQTESWCKEPLSIDIWSHNSAGRSSESSSMVVIFSEMSSKRRSFEFSVEPKDAKIWIHESPPQTDLITLYYLSGEDFVWSSILVGDIKTPYSVPLSKHLRLTGISAESLEPAEKTGNRQSTTGIIPDSEGTNKSTEGVMPLWVVIVIVVCIFGVVMVGFLAVKRSSQTRHRNKQPPITIRPTNPLPHYEHELYYSDYREEAPRDHFGDTSEQYQVASYEVTPQKMSLGENGSVENKPLLVVNRKLAGVQDPDEYTQPGNFNLSGDSPTSSPSLPLQMTSGYVEGSTDDEGSHVSC